jgi:hypothetical protein
MSDALSLIVEPAVVAPAAPTQPVSAPILTEAQVAAISAPAAPAPARVVPYKRWLLAGGLVVAIILAGALKAGHKRHAPHVWAPTPIAESIQKPAAPLPEVVCGPVVAPAPTIPPAAINPAPFPDVPVPKPAPRKRATGRNHI